jgi:TonB family protein
MFRLIRAGLPALFAVSFSLWSQTPALPIDPAALIELAHQRNGLIGDDVKPWHVHGFYRTYDEKGKLENDGAYEEWWLSPTKFKRSFASPRFTQTDYSNGSALLREGAQDWPDGFELALRERLIDPVPSVSLLKDIELKSDSEAADKSKVRCVSLVYPLRPNLRVAGDYFRAFCFEPALPVLRMNSGGQSSKTIYNHLVSFQNHYLAKQIQIFSSGKLRAELNLDLVELIKDPLDAMIAPPLTAAPVDLATIHFKASHTQFPELLKKAAPEYPQEAKSMRSQGTVVIEAFVGTDGRIAHMTVVSGPFDLRQAAQDAVRQWVYWPPMIMGQPRSFDIEIKVIFQLG